MRSFGRSMVAALALVVWLAAPAVTSAGTSFEDSHAECSYPKMFDLMIMRPVGLVGLALGTALFVPYGPLAAVTSPDGFAAPWRTFVAEPFSFTFGRPLGQCTPQSLDGI
jgi:hypothetical protein